MRNAAETSLYPPVKSFLEDLGFEVKGEIGGCDLVALSGGETTRVVIGELKRAFNLELVLQGVDRAGACDEIWLAAPLAGGRERDARFRNLCRRLGFGLLGVCENGRVEVLVSADAPAPRRDPKRRSRLAGEHRRRQGDPMAGGATRIPVMTAYRQTALACAALMREGPAGLAGLRAASPRAADIMRHNVYGWFERVGRGVYGLTEAGRAALARWAP